MREEWGQDQRRLAARNGNPPVPARRTRSPSSDHGTHGLAAVVGSGNAIQKEWAEYFAQIREERIEDQRRLAWASDGQPDIWCSYARG